MPTIPPLTLPNNGDDAVVDQYNAALQQILSVINGGLDQDNIGDGAVILSKLATSVANALVPVGTVVPFAGSSAPNADWLLCYGQAVSRSTYSTLFAIIGTNYGTGDGSTTFNLPDFRGRVPVGNDAMGGSAANRTQRSTTITTTNASPTATVGSATGLSRGMFIVSTNVPAGTTIVSISGTTITMSANASAAGTGTAARFSMLADAQSLGKVGGTDVHALHVDQLASHAHTINLAQTAVRNDASQIGVYTGGATHPTTSLANGGDQAHPNLQPSQVVNYLIKA